ncbi:MAG TPA: hypothetical protein VJK02_11200 [Anaerolineales bacterium]|nr:hypothetical protein [Anaerolineales bacterium]
MPERAPLQVIPTGLLGFLQLKNGGQFPQSLASEALVPEIDLLRWYLSAEASQVVAGDQAINALGNWGTALVVPQREWWYLHRMAVACNLVAAETISLTLGVVLPGTGVHFALSPIHVLNAGQANPAASIATTVELFLPPTSSLNINVVQLTTAAAIEAGPRAWITRLPA